jgi:nucleoside-diphosphate-sugar epimerase
MGHDEAGWPATRLLDTSRALQEFVFTAQVRLPEGTSQTIEWYRRYATADVAMQI